MISFLILHHVYYNSFFHYMHPTIIAICLFDMSFIAKILYIILYYIINSKNATLKGVIFCFADACAPGNPKDASVEDLKELFKKIIK